MTKAHTLDFLSFLLASLFCSRILSRIHITFIYHTSLGFPCFWWPWHFLRSIDEVYDRMCLRWNLPLIFLLSKLGLYIFGRKPIEVMCHFHHIKSRIHTVNMTPLLMLNLWCGWGNMNQVAPILKLLFYSSFQTLWKEVSLHNPHSRIRSHAPFPWRMWQVQQGFPQISRTINTFYMIYLERN